MNAASEALEFERAIEYRELYQQRKESGTETEDYRFQRGRPGHTGGGVRKKRTRWCRCFLSGAAG